MALTVAAVGAAAGLIVAAVAGRATPAEHGRPTPAASIATGHNLTIAASTLPVLAPATTVPAATPVQQFYDQGFEQGFSTPPNRAELAQVASVALPAPTVAGGWPELTAPASPTAWTFRFVSGLLDIDFARRSRQDLGAWLVAEQAPDLMPGIPADAREGELYTTVTDPSITGQPSPVPDPAVWQADAADGVRWSVANLQVQVDPQWQAMINAGWQPRDLRAVVEDVSGTLTATASDQATTQRFSLTVQIGSAAYHPGYGTVLVSGWSLR